MINSVHALRLSEVGGTLLGATVRKAGRDVGPSSYTEFSTLTLADGSLQHVSLQNSLTRDLTSGLSKDQLYSCSHAQFPATGNFVGSIPISCFDGVQWVLRSIHRDGAAKSNLAAWRFPADMQVRLSS